MQYWGKKKNNQTLRILEKNFFPKAYGKAHFSSTSQNENSSFIREKKTNHVECMLPNGPANFIVQTKPVI